MKVAKAKIYVRLQGGMGNQLFQISAALRIRTMNSSSYQIIVDTRFLRNYNTNRNFATSFFLKCVDNVKILEHWHDDILSFIINLSRIAKLITCYNRLFCFFNTVNDINIKSGSPSSMYTFLDGYFQDTVEPLNESFRRFVQFYLCRSMQHMQSNTQHDPNIRSVAIHLRRGDYTHGKNTQIYNSLGFDYYLNCISLLPKDTIYNFYVFSDDESQGTKLANLIDGTFVSNKYISLDDEFVGFLSCDQYIIANSTFSWWASYLGHKYNKQIFAPFHWYVDNNENGTNQLVAKNYVCVA